MKKVLRVSELSKTFRVPKKAPGIVASIRSLLRREMVSKRAVREVSFDVEEGEIVGLVGANGAGKTTLVKMLAGIIHPSAGDAEVLGYRPWERDNRLRRQLSLIMGQKAQLWWDLPAADCFLLLREIYQIPKAQYDETLAWLTEVLDVREQLEIQIRRLSLGERMKMELVAALLHSPKVVYLDEPTIGLDLTAQKSVRSFLLEYRAQRQPAMLLTSHYMEDIEQLCERLMILRGGRLVYDGPLCDVVERFATHKVLRARLHAGSDRLPAETVEKMGEIIAYDDESLRLRVRRDAVAEVAATVLARLRVADLVIEETDIGTIIENLLGTRRAPSAGIDIETNEASQIPGGLD